MSIQKNWERYGWRVSYLEMRDAPEIEFDLSLGSNLGDCHYCGNGVGRRFGYVCIDDNRNATKSVWIICQLCGYKNGPMGHEVFLALFGLQTVPILYDRRCEFCNGNGCRECSCGKVCAVNYCPTPYEHLHNHHISPRAYRDRFARWVNWPTIVLCRNHHHEWHCAVTPELVNRANAA